MNFLDNARQLVRLYVDNENSPADVQILSKEQKQSGIDELYEKIKKSDMTETEYLRNWCKEVAGIDYKTFMKWKDSKKHPALSLKKEKRISYVMDKDNKYTCLRYIPILEEYKKDKDSPISERILNRLEVSNTQGLLLEAAYHPSTLRQIATPLKEIYEALKQAWILCDTDKSATFDQQIDNSKNVINILEKIENYFRKDPIFFLHMNIVAKVQYKDTIIKEFAEKQILYICISALRREREDVAPPDIGLEPNFDKLIRRN